MPKHISTDGDAARQFKLAAFLALAILAGYFMYAAIVASEATPAGKILLWSLAGLLALAALVCCITWRRSAPRPSRRQPRRLIAAAILQQRWIRTVTQIVPNRAYPHRGYEVYSLTLSNGRAWFFCWLGGDPVPMVARHARPNVVALYTPSAAGIMRGTARTDEHVSLPHLLMRHHASDSQEGMTHLSPSATRALFRDLRALRGRPVKQIA